MLHPWHAPWALLPFIFSLCKKKKKILTASPWWNTPQLIDPNPICHSILISQHICPPYLAMYPQYKCSIIVYQVNKHSPFPLRDHPASFIQMQSYLLFRMSLKRRPSLSTHCPGPTSSSDFWSCLWQLFLFYKNINIHS